MAITFEIHPAIGIARVGNSTGSFLGPEPGVRPPTKYRDRSGNLLRQAARFRVFRCDRGSDGRLRSATEVTAAEARITWTVHVANAKGAAEEFPPVATKPERRGVRLRNAKVADRAELVIDPGPRTVGPGETAAFDSGRFLGTVVPLGEIRGEADGRLLVLGATGTSGFVSADGAPVPIGHFANNDRWFDDMSDGPVTATVDLGAGKAPVEAKPARVVVAPPDYAPGLTNLVTLYDVALQAAVDRGFLSAPATVSFSRDVQPVLARVLGYQWLLELGRQGHGEGSLGDFSMRWTELSDPSKDQAFRRQNVFGMLRNPAEPVMDADFGFMPRLHHSEYGKFPTAVLRLTPTTYGVLGRWAEGAFVSDLDDPPVVEELLPDALDRAALEACSGGPFYPGIEVGRVMADPRTYREAFRVDAASHGPGALTAGNAVPWQADFLACSVDPQPGLAWWPAQRPYQVLTRADSRKTQFWDRGVTGYSGMVDQWHRLGVVVEKRRPDGSTVFVETERRAIRG